MLKKLVVFLIILFSIPAVANASTYHVSASTFIPTGNETVFNGTLLYDGENDTGWIGKSDNLADEWLRFSFPAKVIVDSVVIRNGIGSDDDFKKVNRVKDIVVMFSGGEKQGFVLNDTPKRQLIKIADHPTTSLKLSVRSVYSSKSVSSAGLSEVVINYHRPGEEKADLVTENEPLVTHRKLTEGEKEYLKHKMDKLERKKQALKEIRAFFDKFYTSFVTINNEYPRMFTEDNFLRESAMFESFRSMLETRGVLKKYQEAVVSTSGLRYTIRTLTPTEVELWVKGEYTVVYDLHPHNVPENALYHLHKEHGEWKIKNKMEY